MLAIEQIGRLTSKFQMQKDNGCYAIGLTGLRVSGFASETILCAKMMLKTECVFLASGGGFSP